MTNKFYDEYEKFFEHFSQPSLTIDQMQTYLNKIPKKTMKNHISINTTNKENLNILFILIQNSKSDEDCLAKIKLLIEKYNINYNCLDSYQRGVLFYTCEKGFLKSTKYLLEKINFDIDSFDIYERNIFFYAMRSLNIELIKYLDEKYYYSIFDPDCDYMPCYFEIFKNSIFNDKKLITENKIKIKNIFEFILNRGFDLFYKNKDNKYFLEVCNEYGVEDILKEVIQENLTKKNNSSINEKYIELSSSSSPVSNVIILNEEEKKDKNIKNDDKMETEENYNTNKNIEDNVMIIEESCSNNENNIEKNEENINENINKNIDNNKMITEDIMNNKDNIIDTTTKNDKNKNSEIKKESNKKISKDDLYNKENNTQNNIKNNMITEDDDLNNNKNNNISNNIVNNSEKNNKDNNKINTDDDNNILEKSNDSFVECSNCKCLSMSPVKINRQFRLNTKEIYKDDKDDKNENSNNIHTPDINTSTNCIQNNNACCKSNDLPKINDFDDNCQVEVTKKNNNSNLSNKSSHTCDNNHDLSRTKKIYCIYYTFDSIKRIYILKNIDQIVKRLEKHTGNKIIKKLLDNMILPDKQINKNNNI